MATVLTKQTAFAAPPPGKPADLTSGMQPAASGSIIGRTAAPDALLAGQDIGKATGAGYVKVTVRP